MASNSSSVQVPDKKEPPSTPSSARKEKRIQWWYDNMDKRLDLGSSSTTPNGANDNSPTKSTLNKAEKALSYGTALSVPSVSRTERRKKFAKTKTDLVLADDPGNPAAAAAALAAKNRAAKNFTVFVGQIPFDAKEEDVRKRFESVGVIKSFRWRTNPKTKKFKGMAFVEFENKGAYMRAFQLHHTLINDRPINVEATAPGGRKSKFRKERIKEKTTDLQKQAVERLERQKANAARNKNPPPNETVVESANTFIKPEPSDIPVKKRSADDSGSTPQNGQSKRVKVETSTDLPRTKKTIKPAKAKRNLLRKEKKYGDKVVVADSTKSPPEAGKTGNIDSTDSGKLATIKSKHDVGDFNPQKPAPTSPWKPSNKNSTTASPVFAPKISGVKPREQHLAALDKPKTHIIFGD